MSNFNDILNFKDIDKLHLLLKVVHQHQPGPGGAELLSAYLQQEMQFTREQAVCYSTSVLTRNLEDSADLVRQNAQKLVGKWSRGSSAGSAGNLVVSSTDSWVFTETLLYEYRSESYEGYTSPFGGGYSMPSSSSTYGIWAPGDVPESPLSIVTIGDDGQCWRRTVEWSDSGQSRPAGMTFDGKRFGRM